MSMAEREHAIKRFEFLCDELACKISGACGGPTVPSLWLILQDSTMLLYTLEEEAKAIGLHAVPVEVRTSDQGAVKMTVRVIDSPLEGKAAEHYVYDLNQQECSDLRQWLLNALERWKRYVRSPYIAQKAAASSAIGANCEASFVDLLGRVIRRVQAKPDLLRGYIWHRPDTLNITEINAAAKAIGIGPVFAIGEAPDWASAPNLPADHPVNTKTVECLIVYHPDGSEFRLRRSSGLLDDWSSFPVTETIARLEAWAEAAVQVSGDSVPSSNSATGFLGGSDLANALGVHLSRQEAFFQQLKRRRAELGDDNWIEAQDRRPRDPQFLYRADSPKLLKLAAAYKQPKSA